MVSQNIYRYLWAVRHNESKSGKKPLSKQVSSFYNNSAGPNPTPKPEHILKARTLSKAWT